MIYYVEMIIHEWNLCETKRIENELWNWELSNQMMSAIRFVFAECNVAVNVLIMMEISNLAN